MGTTKKKILTKKKETENDANKEEKPEKPKKVMPPKPWLMKKSLKLKNMQESENTTSANDEFKIDILAPSLEPKTGINEPDVNDKEENTQQPLPKEDKIAQGTYNLDFLDDLSSVNPFETKSKINTSAVATDDFSNV